MRQRYRLAMRQLAYVPRTLRLIFAATSVPLTLVWLLLLIIQGILPGLNVYLTKLVLDGAQIALGQGTDWENVRLFLIPAALMGGAMLLAQIVTGAQSYVQASQAEHLQDHVQGLVQGKAIELDLEFFDVSESYDQLERASGEAGSRAQELLNSLGGVLQRSLGLIGIGAVLLPYGWWLPFVLLLGAAPALWVVVRHNRRYHQWWQSTSQFRRRIQYYNMLLTLNLSAAEMRLLGLGNFYKKAWAALREKLRNERLSLIRRQGLAKVGAGFISLAITGTVMVWVIMRALQGFASLGDVGLFYRAFNEGQGLLRTLLDNTGRALTSVLFVEHLFKLLELKPAISSPSAPTAIPEKISKGIKFEDVTFKYKGTKRPALEHFSLQVPAGKVTAIVGPNGAGKSTLTKLLCGLYHPDRGRVSFDDVDIRSFKVEQLRRVVTVMMQSPIQYQATAADNIAAGDLETERTKERLVEAAKGALVHETLESLPQGYDTQLGRFFSGGVELSGGQWQRVMLARAFYRQSPIVVLDEPTSAMDSWAENQWLQKFGEMVEGRTTLIITHRFTTAMHADVIHVMVDGKVIESGTHTSLLELNGYYAQSWRSQIEQGWRPDDMQQTETEEAEMQKNTAMQGV